MIIYYLLLIFLIIILIKDFQSSKGFIKQKIFHVIALITLLYIFQDSFRLIFYNIKDYFIKYNIACGVIPPFANFIITMLHLILNFIIFMLIFGLFVRKEISRIALVKLLPISIIFVFYSMYKVYLQQESAAGRIVSIIVSVLFILLELGIFFLYKSKFMIIFFQSNRNKSQNFNKDDEN